MYISPLLKSCYASRVETGVESNILYTDVYLPPSKACCTHGNTLSDVYLPRSKVCYVCGTESDIIYRFSQA